MRSITVIRKHPPCLGTTPPPSLFVDALETGMIALENRLLYKQRFVECLGQRVARGACLCKRLANHTRVACVCHTMWVRGSPRMFSGIPWSSQDIRLVRGHCMRSITVIRQHPPFLGTPPPPSLFVDALERALIALKNGRFV